VDTAELEDGLVYVKDFGTETNESKGIFGHDRNELWNTYKKNASCGCQFDLLKETRNEETRVEAGGLRQ
jgi:hypothetical protein